MAALLAAWAFASCSGGEPDAHEPHPSPSNAGACNDLPLIGSDGGMVLGSDWSDEQHPYGAPVVLHLCATVNGGGRLHVAVSGTGITVRPTHARVDPAGNGIVPVRVTVAKGAAGGFRIQQEAGGQVFGDTPGPAIITEADGWHFEEVP